MKIALAIDHFHPTKGGAERSLDEILSALHDRGHTLHLAALSWDKTVEARMKVHPVAAATFPRWRRDLAFAKNCSTVLKKISPDLVLGVRHIVNVDVFLARNGLYCESLKSTLLAKPSVLRKFSQQILPKHHVLLSLEKKLFARRPPPLVIAPSHLVAQHCFTNFSFPPERVCVVPNGVDLEKFRPAPSEKRQRLREALGLGDEIVFVFAAHNFRLKGLDCLLAAWKRLPRNNFKKLLVIGRDKPPAEAAEFKDIRFLGVRADTIEIFQAADVLVHPTFSDTFGRVIIEALACGLPVITTRLAGASELITDGREGYILDSPEQTNALAEKIAQFNDRESLELFSRAARTLAERYPKSAYLAKTVDAIEAEGKRKQQ